MDRDEALQVAADKAAVLRTWSYAELASLIGKPDTIEVTAPSDTTYQVELQAHWDGAKGGDVRVSVAVDDGGWRALAPLGIDFIMAPDGTFVGES